MLFLDGVYLDVVNGSPARFLWVKAPTSDELTRLVHTIAQRIARFLERQGLLEQDAEQGYLTSDAVEAGPMDQLLGHSITYPQPWGRNKATRCSRCKPYLPAIQATRSRIRWARWPAFLCMPA